MADIHVKITEVEKIDSLDTTDSVYVNNNGKLKQASINDILASTTIGTQVTALEGEVDTLQSDVDDMSSTLDAYNDRYMVGFKPVTVDDISNDLNNLASGQTVSYNNAAAANVVNAPITQAVRVYCILGFSNNLVQIAFHYRSHNIYTRYYNSGAWSDWNNNKGQIDAINANLPNQPITAVEQTFSIADCVNATPRNAISSYIYTDYNIPADYPTDMDATYRSVVTVRKISNYAARLSIVSTQSDGTPDFIEGYYNNTTEKIFFWSTKYSKKISGIATKYHTRLTSIQNVDTSFVAPKNGIIRLAARASSAGASVNVKSVGSFANHYIYMRTLHSANQHDFGEFNVFEGQEILIESSGLSSLTASFIDYI